MSAEWKQGLCGCMDDCETCMCGSFCTPCLIYRNAEDLNKSGILCCLASFIAPCIPLLLLRGEAREKYGIDGSTIGDVGAAVCCSACVNCQTASEIKQHGDNS